MMFKVLFCIFAVSVTLVASCGEPCANNGDCTDTLCTYCQNGATCVDGMKCGSPCEVTSDCSHSCSVCAPTNANPTAKICQPACNQTCGTDADCQGGNFNGGCGSCISGTCQYRPPGPPPPPPPPPTVPCGAVCQTTDQCPGTCSVCAPTGPAPSGQNATLYCQPACNQTCKAASDCFGPYNGGCGNCVNGKCTTGKFCATACMSDSECGTFGFPYCTKCVAGKCSGACGTKCINDGTCDPASACPRCVSGTCSAPQSCGGACTVDQDCPARSVSNPVSCWACVRNVCVNPSAVVSQP